jgi:hypothetical protein
VLRGAAPVVVPGATGAGRTAGGLRSVGVADWAWAEAVTKIAASVIKLSDVFRISCASLWGCNANLLRRLPKCNSCLRACAAASGACCKGHDEPAPNKKGSDLKVSDGAVDRGCSAGAEAPRAVLLRSKLSMCSGARRAPFGACSCATPRLQRLLGLEASLSLVRHHCFIRCQAALRVKPPQSSCQGE